MAVPNAPALSHVEAFTGEHPVVEHANEVVDTVNAIVDMLSPGGGQPNGGGAVPLQFVATAIDPATKAVKLRFIIVTGTLGQEITDDSQLG